jgi:cytochrome P450
VAEFGATLPSMVICELLGVPAADRVWVKEKIDAKIESSQPQKLQTEWVRSFRA